MTYKQRYMEMKKAIKKLISDKYFEKFNSRDLFFLMDEKTKGIVFLSETLFNDSFGLQFFLDDAGLNYLHDAYTTENGFSINHFFTDSILLCMVTKKDLTRDDVAFLKKHELRVMPENNLIPYSFKEGYGLSYLSSKELDHCLTYVYYLMSLLKNELQDILEASKNERITVAAFDTTHMTYEVRYSRMVDLETFPRYKKAEGEFIKEFQDSTYVDDTCQIAQCYLPIDKESKEPYPSILLAYYEQKDTYTYQVIPCTPQQLPEYIYGFMDETFKAYGLPTNIKMNHRKLYAKCFKTLKGLNIDVRFQRENEAIDELLYDVIEKEVNGVGEVLTSNGVTSLVS